MHKRLQDSIVLALTGALLFVSQVVMAALPNIEIVSVLIIVLTLTYRFRALISVYLFVLMQGLFYGFSLWFISYLYVWAILVLVTMALRRVRSPFLWAVIAGAFGLCFGTLTAVPCLFIGGVGYTVSYIVAGLTFDALHCVGNFLTTLILFVPLRKLLTMLDRSAAS